MSTSDPAAAQAFRKLRFAGVDEAIREVERLAAADAAGKLQRSGNWTAGQVFAHVAAWIEYGYDGYPMKPVPWILRVYLRWQMRKYLKRGMPRGVRIPGVADGTYGQDPLPTAAAADRLRAALRRLGSEPARHDSPAFGRLTDEERISLNLRHAELHLGYLIA